MNCNCECKCIKEQEYCCEVFRDIPREYCAVTRVNTINMEWGNIELKFCPKCGKQQQKSLLQEWKSILHKEYGVEDYYASKWNPLVPEEFKSDAWWKKRGL